MCVMVNSTVGLREIPFVQNEALTLTVFVSARQIFGQGTMDAFGPSQSNLAREADMQRIKWPKGRNFAFTVFDDPDGQSLEVTQLVYSFLGDLGFRTTI